MDSVIKIKQIKNEEKINSYDFYQNLVFKILKNFKKGKINISLTTGEVLSFGESNDITVDLKIKNNSFFKKIILGGDIGFGESYTDGDFETSNLTNVIKWAILNIENSGFISGSKKKFFFTNILKIFNRFSHLSKKNTLSGSQKNISFHYDLSNEFYKLMLDQSMSYSSAIYLKKNESLYDAQINKLEKICQLLDLKENDHVLEIGCGWGGFIEYAVKKYKCQITAITISKEQFDFTQKRIIENGLEKNVTLKLQDYRTLTGNFDKIVSVEMIEAVGFEYYKSFVKKCSELLKADGILVLQAITSPDSRFEQFKSGVDWIQKHIFPGSLLPSIGVLNKTFNEYSDLHLFNLHDFGLSYEKTLSEWKNNFQNNLEKIKELNLSDHFLRKWYYYLSYCEAAFHTRNISVVHLTYTRPNNTKFHYKK